MCTVTFIPRDSGFYVAMNRDERIARPTANPPAMFRHRSVESVYPVDSEGGTWIAANHMGVAFALLNWNDARVLREKSRTRGVVIPALAASACSQAADLLLGRLDLDGILPFRLVGFFPSEGCVKEWYWDQRAIERRSFAWTRRQWCSSSLSDETAALARTRAFEQKLAGDDAVSLTWLRQLHSSHDDDNRPFSHCVHREHVKTVSYTEFVCSDQRIECNYFAGSPCNTTVTRHGTSLRLMRTTAFVPELVLNKVQRPCVSPHT